MRVAVRVERGWIDVPEATVETCRLPQLFCVTTSRSVLEALVAACGGAALDEVEADAIVPYFEDLINDTVGFFAIMPAA